MSGKSFNREKVKLFSQIRKTNKSIFKEVEIDFYSKFNDGLINWMVWYKDEQTHLKKTISYGIKFKRIQLENESFFTKEGKMRGYAVKMLAGI